MRELLLTQGVEDIALEDLAKITMPTLVLIGDEDRDNGKPALITKSGSFFRGDDYVEMNMNTFRFAYITKKGMHYVLPRIPELHAHASVTIEGRDNDELPEQIICAGRLRGLEFPKEQTH